jgi:hypothetical protein
MASEKEQEWGGPTPRYVSFQVLLPGKALPAICTKDHGFDSHIFFRRCPGRVVQSRLAGNSGKNKIKIKTNMKGVRNRKGRIDWQSRCV